MRKEKVFTSMLFSFCFGKRDVPFRAKYQIAVLKFKFLDVLELLPYLNADCIQCAGKIAIFRLVSIHHSSLFKVKLVASNSQFFNT